MNKIAILLLLFAISLFANIGKISAFSGDVKIDRNTKLLNATVGFILEQKDTVKTSENAKAQIVFEDGTVVSIGKNAILNINEFINDTTNPKNSKVNIKFAEGAFKTITGGIGKVAPDRFKLQTKSASIGIRGTIIYGNQQMVACTQGEIEVEAGGIKQILPAGTMTKIQPDGTPTDPEPIEDEDLGGVADDVGDTGNGNDGTSPQGNTEGEMEIEPLPVGLIKQNTPLNILPTSQNLLDLDAIETINIENIQQQSNDINQKDYDKLIPTFAILSSSINNGLITYTVTLSNPTDTNSPAIVTVNVNGTNYDITIPPGESSNSFTFNATNLIYNTPYNSTFSLNANIVQIIGGNFANLNYSDTPHTVVLQGAFVPPTEPIVVLPQQFSFSGVGKRLEFYSNSLSLLDINGIVEITPTSFDSNGKTIADISISNPPIAGDILNSVTLGFNEGDDVYWGYWATEDTVNHIPLDVPWIIGIQTPVNLIPLSGSATFQGTVIGNVFNTTNSTYTNILQNSYNVFNVTIDFGGSAGNVTGTISFQDGFNNTWQGSLTGATDVNSFGGLISVSGGNLSNGGGNFGGNIYGENEIKAIGGGFYMYGEDNLNTTFEANGVFKAGVQ